MNYTNGRSYNIVKHVLRNLLVEEQQFSKQLFVDVQVACNVFFLSVTIVLYSYCLVYVDVRELSFV